MHIGPTFVTAILLAGAATASVPSDTCLRQVRSARIDAQRGNAEVALARLREAADACPDDLGPLLALLGATPDAGGGEALLRRLDERLADPERPLNLTEVRVLARQHDADEDLLRRILPRLRALAQSSADSAVLATLADLEERLGHLDAVAAGLERLAKLRVDEELSWRLVRLYRRLERPADEARWLKIVVAEAPEWREVYVQALSRAGEVDEVRRQIALLEEETMPRKVREMAAWNLYDQGLDEAAEALFVEALDDRPHDPTLRKILLNLFGSEEDRRRYAESEAVRWEQVSDPQELFDEGTLLLTAGDVEAALPLLRRAAPGLSDLEAAWYNLGMAAYHVKDWETVETAFARASELNPDRGAAFFFRGLALVELERCAEAVDELGRALRLDPHRALAHYHRSVCYSELGDEEAAAAEMELYDATRQ